MKFYNERKNNYLGVAEAEAEAEAFGVVLGDVLGVCFAVADGVAIIEADAVALGSGEIKITLTLLSSFDKGEIISGFLKIAANTIITRSKTKSITPKSNSFLPLFGLFSIPSILA